MLDPLNMSWSRHRERPPIYLLALRGLGAVFGAALLVIAAYHWLVVEDGQSALGLAAFGFFILVYNAVSGLFVLFQSEILKHAFAQMQKKEIAKTASRRANGD